MMQKTVSDKQLVFAFEKTLAVTPEDAQMPHFLCLSPYFKPIADRNVANTQGFDDKDGESFRLGDFEMLRFGPGLDTYDFETLAAIFQIINTKAKLPSAVMAKTRAAIVAGNNRVLPNFDELNIAEDADSVTGSITIDYTFGLTSAHAINRYLNRGVDGDSIETCRASIIRLSKTHCDLINHQTDRRDDQIPFFNIQRNKRGSYFIFFPIQMDLIFKKLLDFNLVTYRRLTAAGRAMMLWMSPISGEYEILLENARLRSNYHRPMKEFKRDLVTGRKNQNIKPALELMEEEGFIDCWSIEGTGRKTPFVLKFTRP